MPLADMPLEKLLKYEGRNPKPADFDKFWDNSIAEMKALDPQIELIAHPLSSVNAELFDMYFTGVGGARIYAKFMRPKNITKPVPAVVFFHGYSANSGDWTTCFSYLLQGYCVAALDVRGQGGKSEDCGCVFGNTLNGHIIRGLSDDPEKFLFRNIFLDCAQLVGILMDMPEVDEDRVGVTGLSQGGGLTLACASLEPRIKLAAPIYPFLCDYQRVWEMDLAQGAYGEIKEYFKRFDPTHAREAQLFEKLGYIDVQHLTTRINAEVLMLVGLMDTTCPPSTQFAAYNKIKSEKNLKIYPDFGHESLPGSSDTIFEFMMDL